MGMTQLENQGEVDILKIVSTMRQDRGGMVQTEKQYIFLHQVIHIAMDSYRGNFVSRDFIAISSRLANHSQYHQHLAQQYSKLNLTNKGFPSCAIGIVASLSLFSLSLYVAAAELCSPAAQPVSLRPTKVQRTRDHPTAALQLRPQVM